MCNQKRTKRVHKYYLINFYAASVYLSTFLCNIKAVNNFAKNQVEFKTILIRNILSKETFRVENSYNLNSLKLDFTSFESGVYIVSILSVDGNLIVSKKLIKK